MTPAHASNSMNFEFERKILKGILTQGILMESGSPLQLKGSYPSERVGKQH